MSKPISLAMCAFNQKLAKPLTRPRRRARARPNRGRRHSLMPFSLYLVREMNTHSKQLFLDELNYFINSI